MNFFYNQKKEELIINLENIANLAEGRLLLQIEKEKLYLNKLESVIIDFTNICELNSLAITELIKISNKFKKFNPNVKVVFINVQPQVYNLLQLVNIDSLFEIHVV